MWPAQQQPGGGHPPQPDPYQPPGYPPPGQGQPPHPYAGQGAPGTPPYPGQPGYPYGGGGPDHRDDQDDRRRTRRVAIGAVAAVVATAVITGVIVLGGEDPAPAAAGTGERARTSERDTDRAKGPEKPADAPAPAAENPRGAGESEPTVKGWKVVTNPKHGTRFDVPAAWTVAPSGISTFLEDRAKGGGAPLVTMSAPAHLRPDSCTAEGKDGGPSVSSSRATVGTKGGKGAKDTASAATAEAGFWAWGAYAQTEPKGTVRTTPARPFTTASGIRGSLATATAVGVRKNTPCATDGKAAAFTFKDPDGEFRTWVLYADKGVADEIPDATVEKILTTLRLAGTAPR
ncbi:hypothetical protein ABT354_29620 [Streptomyces sp. NPDC000594]|uniref:hypothetical protein n=1 Tax=Streptomyces sp. NPDC000594 TaxID=3154261 RepID=UPI003319AEDE